MVYHLFKMLFRSWNIWISYIRFIATENIGRRLIVDIRNDPDDDGVDDAWMFRVLSHCNAETSSTTYIQEGYLANRNTVIGMTSCGAE